MNKRIRIATLMGLVCGLFCWLGGIYALGNEYTNWQVFYILFHRTLMGFVIGISALRLNWAANGLLLGLLVGTPFALYEQITKDFFGYADWVIIALIPIGAVYGLFIEYMTTKVFKTPSVYNQNK